MPKMSQEESRMKHSVYREVERMRIDASVKRDRANTAAAEAKELKRRSKDLHAEADALDAAADAMALKFLQGFKPDEVEMRPPLPFDGEDPEPRG